MSLVDPAWEYLDPTPDIFAMFQEFDKTFFGGTMTRVELKWSKRMTSCAGLMAPLEGKGGACSIRLSEPLLKLRPRKDLVQTLLHEMIHAHLHVTKCRESDPHGPKFKEHMHRINKIAGTNITVYHNFHDEVNLHKQHWWRCNGHCRNWRPYYGWVKRATNRAPSKNDFWWAQHQQTCGGQYIKVKEPEGYSKKKEAQLQKSLGKNGNLLSMIKKKYNLNHHVSNVTTPKLTDMWKKKQTDGISSKTPLKTNNSSSLSQTKSSPLNSTINKSPSSSFTSNSVTLGTNGNHYSINNLLGQLHKENMERRRQLSGKNDHSMIGHETKNKFDKNHVERKLVYVDLTESPSPQPVSSKNNQNSTLISKKGNFPVKPITQDPEQKSLSKISQSSIREFSKPLKDRNLYESKRSFLSSNVNFIEKNVELSFKSIDKHEKSHHSNICVSPKRKHSSASESFHKKNTSLLSTSTDSSCDNSGNISSPQSNKSSFLTKKDTTAALLLLKKKRKRLLDSSTDPSPDKQKSSSSKFENQSIISNVSSRLNPNFFSSSSYKEKKPLFNESNSPKEKSLNNLVKQTSDSPNSSNKERKPSINNLHTSPSSLSKERKPSGTDSNSSTSLNNKDRKCSPTNSSSFPTFINKGRKTIPTDTSLFHLSNHKEKLKINSVPSQIPTKRHWFRDSSPSHSPYKQIKVSHTKTNSNSEHFTSLSPDKKHSTHSDKYKRKESLTPGASSTDKIFTSSPKDQQTQVKKKKEKLFAQLFGDDSDSEIETEKKPIQMLKYPSSFSSSSLTTENARKSPQKSTSGATFKKSSSSKIQSNHIENYFGTPNKESPKDDLIVIDNYTVSSDRASQSPASQTMVACPVCQKKVPEITVNNHLDECLNMNLINENT